MEVLDQILGEEIPKDVLSKISLEYLLTFRLLPLKWIGEKLKVAAANLVPFYPIDNLSMVLNTPLEVVEMPTDQIENVLRKWMESKVKAPQKLLENTKKESDFFPHLEIREGEDLVRQRSEAPAVKMVNSILLEAIQEKATDVHFHPKISALTVLYRRDGFLHEVHSLPQGLKEEVISRLKVMAKLDVTQRQLPQDGRFSIRSSDREIEVRVSVVPTVQGERVVLRLLDRENLLIRADELGMNREHYQHLRLLMDRPTGMILVTGPTGSGKTTTLYSFISELDLAQRNVMTIEDPVEYKIEGITQIPVRPNLGLTFAQGLRSVLRQDPDVILVGEIRDQETAQIAIRAALTGHLVLTTLHATDAPGAVARLLDIGIEPYLISSALMAVISQRLARKCCLKCEKKGCSFCFSTGFRGRTGVFEYLPLDDDFRHWITQRSDGRVFREEMRRKGMMSLEMAGLQKVEKGITSREEVLRVVG
ncbi:MAG: type II/IV secretion system protein [Chlamydiae bacterium]|nr:type II/IV secretion system protein [Chlamydiota bacterium]MBI3278153.1 type II/IV secretion system protein [Chlamydiota bacterium]